MSVATTLSPELTAAATAVGLLKVDKSLDASWFDDPAGRLKTILSNPPQRQATMQLLDALVPPSQGIGAPAGEQWHPLLNGTPNRHGNLYLTVRTDGLGTSILGLAGGLNGPAAAPSTASLHAHVPLVSANGGTVTAVAGTAANPVELDLRLEVKWSMPAEAIGLTAVRVHLALPFAAAQPVPVVQIVLEGLDVGSGPVAETILDPAHLGPEALNLVTSLITQELKQLAASAGNAELTALATHLMPLLGFGDGLKPLPLDQLAHGGAALRSWLASMAASAGGMDLRKWLGHLAGLVGTSVGPAPAAAGTDEDPWKIPLVALTAASSVYLALATQKAPGTGTSSLLVKLLVQLAPTGAHPAARIDASVTLAMIPLDGALPASVLPAFSATLRAPGDPNDALLTGTVKLDHINAGIRWDGSQLRPLLELIKVDSPGGKFDRLDLTNADSVASAAGAAVRTAILDALGSAPAALHLAALAGLIPPTGKLAWPHLLDPLKLATHPTQAIAQVHADILADAVNNWSYLLEEIRLLVGLADAVTGTGTEKDPWLASFGAAGPISIGIAAWKPSGAAPPQRLRLGLVVKAASNPWIAQARLELFGFDIQAAGATTVQMLGRFHIEAGVDPLPTIPPVADIEIGASSLIVSAGWAPGAAATWSAVLKGVSVSAEGTKVQFDLSFPTAAPFDIHNPLPSLGISAADLEALLRLLVAHAMLSWGGMPAYTLGAFLGIHRGLSGLQSDWPSLIDPGAPGSLFDHPLVALRNWVGAVATGLSSDGTPFAPQLLGWLQAFLRASLPAAPHATLPAFDVAVGGSGTYDYPWSVPLHSNATARLEALAWLEPAGPPPGWATALATTVLRAGDFSALLPLIDELSGFVPSLRALSSAINLGQTGRALEALRDYLSLSDGVVPLSSQLPNDGSWMSGATLLTAAHHLQPKDPAAISQVLEQIDAWAGTDPRAVLLLGPAFSDSTVWHELIVAAETARPGSTKPGTTFNFRIADVSPDAVDLSGVTQSADIYSADLFDDGTGDQPSLVSQIGRLVARIKELRTDAPNLTVTIVAHSTAGLAARQFAADHPELVTGLITIGTPHQGSPLSPLLEPAMASAVRVIQQLVPNGVGGALQDAIDHLAAALDGFVPVPGGPPRSAPYPVGSFTAPPSTDTAGVAALALGGTLQDDLFAPVRQAVNALATAASMPAAPAPPTHLAFGIRAGLGLRSAAAGEVGADATLRADAFRIRLTNGAPEPAHPAQRLLVSIALSRAGGWLLGGPGANAVTGTQPIDARVRWMELGMEVVAGAANRLQLTRNLALHDAAFHGTPVAPEGGDTATAEAIVGAVFHRLADPSPAAGTPVASLLQALQTLGIAVTDPHGGIGLSADAWAALGIDPVGYLGPRLPAALATGSGVLGLTGSVSGPWALALAGLPVELYVAPPPQAGASWTLGVRTTGAASTGLPLGTGVSTILDVGVTLPSLKPGVQASLHLGVIDLVWSTASDQLTLKAPPWVDGLVLYPLPSSANMQALANDMVPRLALSILFSAVMQYIMGPGWRVGAIDALIKDPGKWLARATSLGSSGGGGGLDSGKITQLLNAIADAASYPRGRGIDIHGVELSASGSDPLVISLATLQSIGGVVDVQLSASIDHLMHVTPGGSVTIHADLAGSPWAHLAVTLGIGAGGVTLSLTPGNGDPIQLLPHFSGFGAIAAGLEALLPKVLDDIVAEYGPAAGRPPMLVLALELSQAMDLWDSGGGFAAHAAQIAAIGKPAWMASLGTTVQGATVTAIKNILDDPASPLYQAVPGTFTTTGSLLSWSMDLATIAGAAGAGQVGAKLGWVGGVPALSISATGARPAGGALVADVSAGFVSGQLAFSVALEINVAAGLSFDFGPQVLITLDSGRFAFKVLPLGPGTDGLLAVQLAPTPAVTTAPGGLGKLVEDWLVPVVADLLLAEFKADLAKKLWSTGPTTHDLLLAAKLVDAGDKLQKPLPNIMDMGIGLAVGLATNTSVDLTDTLKLSLVNEGGNLGARLFGSETFAAGDIAVGVNFGPDRPWLTDPDRGLTVYLVKLPASGPPIFKPSLKLVGVGAGLAGVDDSNLVDTSVVTIGGVDGYVFFTLPLDSTAGVADFGAAVEVRKLGLPLGEAMSGSAGGSNPVAASLLSSGGDSSTAPGDSQSVNPTVDVFASYRPGAGLVVQFENQAGPLWIPVHRAFGPIYLDQVGIEFIPPPDQAVDILIDGGVKVAGLSVDVYELGVTVPFKSVLAPDHWTLDLKGLAVAFKTSGVAIAGGLIKNPGPPVEYDGMLLVDLSGRSFTVVGSYSRPSDAQGGFTSLFIFVSLPFVIGGPPYLFITGLGGGAGYNRRLITPEKVTDVESFILVKAIDDDSFANDPMRALMQAALAVPARRGSLWFAAGLRFTSFVVVHSVVVAYVALDRGLEIGVLGLSRMALPDENDAIASVELALKARFSAAEGLLSVQAQLTDNSWLLSHDCQLTGGFAFFMWFQKAQFVLTLGGYHHAFVVPPNFPVVPRLGFHWSVSDAITIKGESYFALTNSCVMAGGRLEASFHDGGIRAWFTLYADLLVAWDPFHYDVAIGVEVGASFSIEVCFIFGCATIGISVSLSADVHVFGPPLHGDAHVDLAIASVTVSFGAPPASIPQYIKDWQVFADKYLLAGDPDKTAVGVHALSGVLAPDPPGAQPAPGTESQPWKMASEFSFLTESRMPANRYREFVTNIDKKAAGASTVDIGPMAETNAATLHGVVLEQKNAGAWQPTAADANHFEIQPQVGQLPEATWRFIRPDQQRAAANTIPALTGLKIIGRAVVEGQSTEIPISKLVDAGSSPLPLNLTIMTASSLQGYGAQADTLAVVAAGAPSDKVLIAAATMLSGNGTFAKLRTAVGLSAGGLSPMAARALTRARSAAPLITPISTGLTMEHKSLGAPPVIAPLPDVGPVSLDGPRLRAVLQGRPAPVGDTPPPARTSVGAVSIIGALPRMAPPRLSALEGARLVRVVSPTASRPTSASLAGRTIRSPEFGWSAGTGHAEDINRAAADVLKDGVTIGAGATHLWDLPVATPLDLVANGGAVRVTCLTRTGNVLHDVEVVADHAVNVPIPEGTALLAVTCLGEALPTAGELPGLGAVSARIAPPNGVAATGWQTGNLLPQVGPAVLIGRGASLTVPRATVPSRSGQRTTDAMVRISEAMAAQSGVETRLPVSTSVVVVILDQADPSAALDGDLAVFVDGATVSAPLRVGGGRRLGLLYDVVARDADVEQLIVAVGSRTGWRLNGVVGLAGLAREWAVRMAGGVPEQLVPDGPLTPEGETVVRLQAKPGGFA